MIIVEALQRPSKPVTTSGVKFADLVRIPVDEMWVLWTGAKDARNEVKQQKRFELVAKRSINDARSDVTNSWDRVTRSCRRQSELLTNAVATLHQRGRATDVLCQARETKLTQNRELGSVVQLRASIKDLNKKIDYSRPVRDV